MLKFLENLLNYIYKKPCYFCGALAESTKMCSACYEDIDFMDTKVNRIVLGVNVYSASLYEKKIQKLIRGLKYHGQKELAYFQAKLMWDYWQKLGINDRFQIVPVPLFKTREKQRKYNHMCLVAKEFCKLSGNIENFSLIKRVKNTMPQYKLNRFERMQNLESAFEIDESKLLDYKVMILDDICTTGSTFEEMINEMQKYNIQDITCFSTSAVS